MHMGGYRDEGSHTRDSRRIPPAYGGVPFTCKIKSLDYMRIPHAYGGVPLVASDCVPSFEYSPCIWGCTELTYEGPVYEGVFPMHMGVYRDRSRAVL